MLINFANLSNEGANISPLQKTGKTYTGGKKEILGAGDLAQAVNDAPPKNSRIFSDEEIGEYIAMHINNGDRDIYSLKNIDSGAQIVEQYSEEIYDTSKDNLEIRICGLEHMWQSTRIYELSLHIVDSSDHFVCFESHQAYAEKDINGNIDYVIDNILDEGGD